MATRKMHHSSWQLAYQTRLACPSFIPPTSFFLILLWKWSVVNSKDSLPSWKSWSKVSCNNYFIIKYPCADSDNKNKHEAKKYEFGECWSWEKRPQGNYTDIEKETLAKNNWYYVLSWRSTIYKCVQLPVLQIRFYEDEHT